jgi:hypothetical protein
MMRSSRSNAHHPKGTPCRPTSFMSPTAATGWMEYVASYSPSLKFSTCSSPVIRTPSSLSVQAVRAQAFGWARSGESAMTCQRGDTPARLRSRPIEPTSSSRPTARQLACRRRRRCAESAERAAGVRGSRRGRSQPSATDADEMIGLPFSFVDSVDTPPCLLRGVVHCQPMKELLTAIRPGGER